MSELYYKRDGSLDIRYTPSRQAMSSSGSYGSSSSGFSEYSGPTYSSYSSPSGSGHYKKDGSLDMRYFSSREAAASGVESGYGSASSYFSGNAPHAHDSHIKDTLCDTKMEEPEQRMQQLKLTGQS